MDACADESIYKFDEVCDNFHYTNIRFQNV